MKTLNIFEQRTKIEIVGAAIGIIGALIGFYYWLDYPIHKGEVPKEEYLFVHLETQIMWIRRVIFLFVPACIALVSTLFNKSYLMYLAFLISLPVIQLIGIKITGPLVYYSFYLYLISALLMSIKKHS